MKGGSSRKSYPAIFWECLQTLHIQCLGIWLIGFVIWNACRTKIKQNKNHFSPPLCSLDLSWATLFTTKSGHLQLYGSIPQLWAQSAAIPTDASQGLYKPFSEHASGSGHACRTLFSLWTVVSLGSHSPKRLPPQLRFSWAVTSFCCLSCTLSFALGTVSVCL